jgi:hypothetical protein
MAWSEDETILLINLWSEDNVQAQIEGCRRNREVYESLARQMGEAGYNRTGVQCREKMKKMKADYWKIRDNNNETGRARWSTAIFEALDKILGEKPATCPPVVLDTLSADQEDTDDTLAVTSDNDGEVESTLLTGSSTPSSAVSERRSSGAAEDNTGSQVISATLEKQKKGKGQKRSFDRQAKGKGRLSSLVDAFSKTMKEINEADTKVLVELEEKRMRYEDARLREQQEFKDRMRREEREYQERRREEREYEDRRRKEERAFQLQMMQMMTG